MNKELVMGQILSLSIVKSPEEYWGTYFQCSGLLWVIWTLINLINIPWIWCSILLTQGDITDFEQTLNTNLDHSSAYYDLLQVIHSIIFDLFNELKPTVVSTHEEAFTSILNAF